jgi:hypothetical protein
MLRAHPVTNQMMLIRSLAALAVSSCLAGCASAAGDAPSEARAPERVGDVVYGDGTNDEGLLELLDAPVVRSTQAEPVIVEPADQSVLTEPRRFEYLARASADHSAAPRPPRTRVPRSPWRSFLDELWVLERTAHAHGNPMNGDAFFLVFSTPAQPKLLRIFTRETSHLPSLPDWKRLASGNGPITLRVTRATFEQGRLAAGGGPYVSQPVHFAIDE